MLTPTYNAEAEPLWGMSAYDFSVFLTSLLIG
jgi:hypothetical protein